MGVLKEFRKLAFWGSDLLKGSPVRKHYDEIKFIIDNYGSEKAEAIGREHLKNILAHARSTVPYYRENTESSAFESFPVITKSTVLANYDGFRSSKFLNAKNTQVSTNGSTGTPFKLFHNRNKRYRHQADNLLFAEKGGYQLGDRMYLLRALHKNDLNSLMRFFRQNFSAYGVLNYTDEEIEKLLGEFTTGESGKCIVCFASMCEVIVNYLDSNNAQPLKTKVKSIVTDGDALSKGTKDKMEYYFGVPVYARYGNMECGVMAQQGPPNSYHYQLNLGSYHFEILDLHEDRPVEPGKMGRIVVTDLFNYCMPLIRYDTGDLAKLGVSDQPNTPAVFETIEGRVVDLIWDTDGGIVSPYLIYTITEKYNELKQFQFAQTGEGVYEYRLNVWGERFDRVDELISESKRYLGQNAQITTKYVDEVPLLKSNKRKPVINEIRER